MSFIDLTASGHGSRGGAGRIGEHQLGVGGDGVNNYWTFAERSQAGRKRVRGLKFNAVSLLSLAVSYGTFLALSLLLPRVAPVWLQGLAIVPAGLVN